MLIVNKDNQKLQYDNRFKNQFDNEGIEYIYIDDTSELAKKILSAHEYTIDVSKKTVIGKDTKKTALVTVNVIKTKEQWKSEISKSPSLLRKEAYQKLTKKEDGTSLIIWENTEITINQANKLFLSYFIEDNSKSNDLKSLIKQAKTYIRNLYPDE